MPNRNSVIPALSLFLALSWDGVAATTATLRFEHVGDFSLPRERTFKGFAISPGSRDILVQYNKEDVLDVLTLPPGGGITVAQHPFCSGEWLNDGRLRVLDKGGNPRILAPQGGVCGVLGSGSRPAADYRFEDDSGAECKPDEILMTWRQIGNDPTSRVGGPGVVGLFLVEDGVRKQITPEGAASPVSRGVLRYSYDRIKRRVFVSAGAVSYYYELDSGKRIVLPGAGIVANRAGLSEGKFDVEYHPVPGEEALLVLLARLTHNGEDYEERRVLLTDLEGHMLFEFPVQVEGRLVGVPQVGRLAFAGETMAFVACNENATRSAIKVYRKARD